VGDGIPQVPINSANRTSQTGPKTTSAVIRLYVQVVWRCIHSSPDPAVASIDPRSCKSFGLGTHTDSNSVPMARTIAVRLPGFGN